MPTQSLPLARILSMLLPLLALSITAATAQAQVDTPAAAEARGAFRAVRDQYQTRSDWNEWAAQLNLPDVQFELLAGERGEPQVLRQAVVELLAGRVPQFSEPPFARLAKALDVRAQELAVIPPAEWPSECARIGNLYHPVTVEDLQTARQAWDRHLDAFELVLPSVREEGSQWNKFLFWPESRDLASPTPAPAPSHELLDRLEARWAAAPAVWDNEELYETSLAARTYLRMLRSYLVGETAGEYETAWNELSELLTTLAADPSDTSRVAAAVTRRESLGQASRLTASIRKLLSRPNMVVEIDQDWLQSQFEQPVQEPYDVNGVFAGTRSVGRGELVGTMRAQILPSQAVGRWLLLFNGVSTARASGTQDRVRVVSRATTRVAATKPFRLDARGLTPERASAGAVTNIVYESIDSPGLPRRRSQAVSETHARRPQAERESAAYARESILEQVNEEAAKVASEFNTSYHAELRDPRINELRPSPHVRVRADDQHMRWECLLEGPASFGALEEPPPMATPAAVVMNLAASAIEEQTLVGIAGRELSGEQLSERMGRASGETATATGDDSFHVAFAADPCDVRFEEGAVRLRLYITKFDSADVKYPAMTVDVAYEPQPREGKLVLVRQGRVRVTPLATGDGEAPQDQRPPADAAAGRGAKIGEGVDGRDRRRGDPASLGRR